MLKGPGGANICDKLTHYYAEGTALSMRALFVRLSAPSAGPKSTTAYRLTAQSDDRLKTFGALLKHRGQLERPGGLRVDAPVRMRLHDFKCCGEIA